MIDVRRAGARYRGGDAAAGIDTRHAFSFGGHYDPADTRFGLLLACNEERLAPGAGFAEHPHRDTEIVTWVLEGVLEHQDRRDPAGPPVRLGPGGLQRLSAAGGVRHVERNGGEVPLRFLQMWLHPDTFGGPPDYAAVPAPAPDGPGPHLLAAAPGAARPAVTLRQRDAALYLLRGSAALPEAPFVYVHVVRGGMRIGDETLAAGDAARISGGGAPRADVVEAAGPAEYLVWEMHAEPSYG
ncbi:MAG TPA: pirin family protein [Streptomyces sp.]